ncbi:MAG: chromosome segregation protein SMC [Deltaproteobacteria bacterium]|nr:chromosome segregation protein SMC [Deltaproteobacteria bacterium]
MRLKRLELQGFKSFLDRTIITFDRGIVGVVGPNGCGKSNIVDAILWVMGEQSAKHLRGDSMIDVIFNGSDTRSPTSMAEVSLILDGEGVVLPPQLAGVEKGGEVSITRRIYRDGNGEFLINKTACRLKDIHELFMDTGVGRRAYSIIEQGSIDRMINVKPDERRLIFEEVAGITKYKSKRKEAEKKLELTRGNLARLEDIISELERQIRSLKVQATRARKYKEFKTELEVADSFLLGRTTFELSQAISTSESLQNELLVKRSEADASFSRLQAQLTEVELLRVQQEKQYQQASEQEHEFSLLVQRLESQGAIIEEQKKHLLQSSANLLEEKGRLEESFSRLQQEQEGTEQDRTVFEQKLLLLDSQIMDDELKLKEVDELRTRLNQTRENLLEQLQQVSQRQTQLLGQKEYALEQNEELDQSSQSLKGKIEHNVSSLQLLRQQLAEVERQVEDCVSRSHKAEIEVAELFSECRETSSKLSETEEKLFQVRGEFHLQNSRLESLRELERNLEGYSPTAKEILLKLSEHSLAATPLADIIQPEAGLEDLIEKYLGSALNTLLVRDADEAKDLARLIVSKNLERVSILALSDLEPSDLEPLDLEPLLTEKRELADESVCPILSKMEIRQGFEQVAERFFGNLFLCNNSETLFDLRTRFPQFSFLCTETGITASKDRSIVSGTLPTKMGVFARRREIEQLVTACGAKQVELDTVTAERENLLHQLESQEKLHSELKDRLSSLHIENVELRKEKEKLMMQVARTELDAKSLNEELDLCVASVDENLRRVEQSTAEWMTLEDKRLATEQEKKEAEIELDKAGESFNQVGSRINDYKVERSAIAERIKSLTEVIARLLQESASLSHRQDRIIQQIADEKQLFESIQLNEEKLRTEKQDTIQKRNDALVRVSELKGACEQTGELLMQYRTSQEEAQQARERILAECQKLEVQLTQQRSELEHVRSISLERYQREAQPLGENANVNLEQLPLLASQLNVTWELLLREEKEALLKEHVQNVRQKVDKYGEVNLTAIHEFDEVQKRYDFLMEQKSDLDNSIRILEEAILKIDEVTKERFSETFDSVNEKFKEIFPILFSGGKAELSLTNSSNALDTGVDIMVQPPGKRLQSIGLLSGGEKALTAVSLVLAIFARKPSPFCLLDEVDAPLDDANVSRFNTVIRKMSERSQFIVITHNKKTMEVADALYGVTMEKSGISKMTSVRLQ